jgi:hypothetical protein
MLSCEHGAIFDRTAMRSSGSIRLGTMTSAQTGSCGLVITDGRRPSTIAVLRQLSRLVGLCKGVSYSSCEACKQGWTLLRRPAGIAAFRGRLSRVSRSFRTRLERRSIHGRRLHQSHSAPLQQGTLLFTSAALLRALHSFQVLLASLKPMVGARIGGGWPDGYIGNANRHTREMLNVWC